MNVRERRGSADLFQLVLVLPIVVALLYGSFEIWKLIMVKQSLSAATYQAARCVSGSGLEEANIKVSTCGELLKNELSNNNLLSEDDVETVTITYYPENRAPSEDIGVFENLPCWERFAIEAELFLPWPIVIAGSSSNPSLTARHSHYIECPPDLVPTPVPPPDI